MKKNNILKGEIDPMKREYDFSKAIQGKFYRPVENLEIPVYLEKEVKEFLSTGLSESPQEIFKKLGIDIAKREFWLSGLKEIEELLKKTEELAKRLGKI